jgi:hypothetical protein
MADSLTMFAMHACAVFAILLFSAAFPFYG